MAVSTIKEEWVSVDIDNRFKFKGMEFEIPKCNKDYIVYNSANLMFDFTNESNMDSVLVKYETSETGLSMIFFNCNFKLFLKFLQKFTFISFGIYRIVFGLALLYLY